VELNEEANCGRIDSKAYVQLYFDSALCSSRRHGTGTGGGD
jgi:hypothetical protein